MTTALLHRYTTGHVLLAQPHRLESCERGLAFSGVERSRPGVLFDCVIIKSSFRALFRCAFYDLTTMSAMSSALTSSSVGTFRHMPSCRTCDIVPVRSLDNTNPYSAANAGLRMSMPIASKRSLETKKWNTLKPTDRIHYGVLNCVELSGREKKRLFDDKGLIVL